MDLRKRLVCPSVSLLRRCVGREEKTGNLPNNDENKSVLTSK